jgi:hypothetical protein
MEAANCLRKHVEHVYTFTMCRDKQERMFATPVSQSGDTTLETMSARALSSSVFSGPRSSGLLQFPKALQIAMRVATFEDIVLAMPRSFLRKALYFLIVAGSLASSSSGSCPNCDSLLQSLASASSAANNGVW